MPSQKQKAHTLRKLHQGPDLLVLVNIWDVASARVIEDLGFPAVATSSAAIANSLGYPDGERISRGEMLETVSRIAAAVSVPVTADMEAGYAATPEEMEDTARELVVSGAVGLNLEDGYDNESQLVDVRLQVEKIEAVREIGERAEVPLVINARTDAYWLKDGGDPKAHFAEAVRRAKAYREAGADCIFVPGLRDPEQIRQFLYESPGPLNILAGAGVPPLDELRKAGVRRVSLGSGPYRAALGIVMRIGKALREAGTYTLMTEYNIPYADLNELVGAK